MTTERWDAIVIGAGHNGLVCAALLAKAGRNVLVLEAGDQVGGAAQTREFADGYSVSACAHLLYQLQPEVIKDLKLNLDLVADDLTTVALSADGQHARLRGKKAKGVEAADADAYRDFMRRLRRYADLLHRHLNRTPPRLGSNKLRDLAALGRLGFDLRRLGRDDMRDFLRIVAMNVHDELNECFENSLIKGALSADAVLGTHLGPRSPTSMLTLLYRLAGQHGRLSLPKDGMRGVAEALAHAAREQGATIRLHTPVARIIVDNGRVAGVETEAGERFDSLKVISSADLKRTVFDLAGAKNFEAGFLKRVQHVRAAGNAAKLHLALDGLPSGDGLDDKDFGGRLLIAPDEHYVERAFNPAKYGENSTEPVVELSFPSVHDDSLAPAGKHVMSAVVQYAPYQLKGGWTAAAKDEFQRRIIKTIATVLPDIEQRIVASELLTPTDIEQEFRITGGHWHHAELAFDQFLFVRPVGGAAQYALPLDGLFMCGAGAHPGGGVSGAPGRNAAREILRREAGHD